MGYGKAKSAGKGQRDGPYTASKGGRKGNWVFVEAPEREEADDSQKVWVGNLSFKTQWQEVKDFFGQVGTVEHAKIFTLDGKGKGKGGKGKSRGQGVVIFSTAAEAELAISSLNGAEFEGREIQVDAWTQSEPKEKSLPPWKGSAKGTAKGAGKGFGKNSGKSQFEETPDSQKVWVGNLNFRTQWQQIKDLMAQVGTVEHVKVFMKDGKGKGKGGKGKGKSRGQGVVTFSSPQEAKKAIKTLNGVDLEGREIQVDTWTTGWTLSE